VKFRVALQVKVRELGHGAGPTQAPALGQRVASDPAGEKHAAWPAGNW